MTQSQPGKFIVFPESYSAGAGAGVSAEAGAGAFCALSIAVAGFGFEASATVARLSSRTVASPFVALSILL